MIILKNELHQMNNENRPIGLNIDNILFNQLLDEYPDL